MRETLLPARNLPRGYLQPELIRRLLDAERNGACSYGLQAQALLMLEPWHREDVDKAGKWCVT